MFRRKPKPVIDVEWLIVGLGNPGGQYDGTRHNIGFEVIDRLAQEHKTKLDVSKHRSRYGTVEIAGVGVALVKPLTFMNLSGQAVAPLMRQFNVKPERILIIADETDLPLGRLRLRGKGSAGGHNGHKSIINALGTTEYPRLRLGIGRVDRDETIDHVLGKFEFEELATAREMVQRAADAVETVLRDGVERAMMAVNGDAKGD